MKISKIVTGPVDAIRRNVAETRARQEAADAWVRQDVAAKQAARAAALGIWCATTDHAPYDFEPIGLLIGPPAATAEDAVWQLQVAARSAGADGVIGTAIVAAIDGDVRGGYGSFKTGFRAYGTTIRRLEGNAA